MTDDLPQSANFLVCAGYFSQFLDWCYGHEISPKSVRVKYVRDHTVLQGHQPPTWLLVKTGTWFNRTELLPHIEAYERQQGAATSLQLA